MAITQAHLTDTVTFGTSLTSGTFTPSANKLQLAFAGFDAIADPSPVTISTTTGLNFVLVGSVGANDGGSHFCQVYVYRAMKAGGLGAGTVTINTIASNNYFISLTVDEFDGVDTSGTDGANAVVQFATNSVITSASVSATLGAFANAANGTYGAVILYDYALQSMTGNSYTAGFSNAYTYTNANKQWGAAAWWRADNSTANVAAPVGTASATMALLALELSSGAPPPSDTFTAAWSSQGTILIPGRARMVPSGPIPGPRIP